MLEDLKREMKEIKALRDEENRKIQEKEDFAGELEVHLGESLERIEQLNAELQRIKKKEENIKQMADSIQTIQYTKIEKSVLHEFLIPKYALILEYLKRKTKKLDSHFNDRIPKIIPEEKRNTYTVTVIGVQGHHQAFKDILKNLLTLSNIKERATSFYQRHLNRITRSINQTLFKVQPNTKYWKQYSKCFYGLLKSENEQYSIKFKDFIGQKTTELGELFVLGNLKSPWTEIRRETDSFMEQYPFLNEIERFKHQALEKFIEQNISFQRLKLGKKPTKESINTLQYFISKIKKIFQDDPQYTGYHLKQFCLIPQILERLMIYHCCFTIQLPLYESSKELLKDIKKNTVTAISTSTGSGENLHIQPSIWSLFF